MNMKKILLLGAALSTVATMASAQTFSATPLRSIDVSTIETLPTGIAWHAASESLYVVGFNQKRIVKIPLPTRVAAPTAALFVNTSSTDTPAGTVTWGGGRGLQCARISGNTLVVSGDQGTNGAVLQYDLSSVTPDVVVDSYLGATQLGGQNYRTGGVDFYAGNFVITNTTGGPGGGASVMNATMDALVGTHKTGFLTGAGASFPRQVLAVGDDVYVSLADAAAPESISRLSGGTAGQVGDKTLTNDWYTYSAAVSSSVGYGVTYWNYTTGSKQYVISSAADPANSSVTFIDMADPTNATPLRMTNASNGTERSRGTAVFTVNGNTYLAVTTTNVADDAGGRVLIFGIDGGVLADPVVSAVSDWATFE